MEISAKTNNRQNKLNNSVHRICKIQSKKLIEQKQNKKQTNEQTNKQCIKMC